MGLHDIASRRLSSLNTKLNILGSTSSHLSTMSPSSSSSKTMPATVKSTFLRLPLVPPASRLQNNLLPDPVTPAPEAIVATPDSRPSYVRRSRAVGQGSHFSFVTPLPLPFPYDFPKRSAATEGEEGAGAVEGKEAAAKQAEDLEATIREYEVQPSDVEGGGEGASLHSLRAFLPPARREPEFPSARLLGVSPFALCDCLPHLDVGDSLEWIAASSGVKERWSSGPLYDAEAEAESTDGSASSSPASARRELSEAVSGRAIGAILPAKLGPGAGYAVEAILASEKETPPEDAQARFERRSKTLKGAEDRGYAPWSLCYAGHQFGTWAGQLGDGRAVSLLETLNPTTSERWEVQLKGAGRTPYSRFADGLATLASSVREYLCSEAMAGLGIATSRALAVTMLSDEVYVLRERRNIAAITTRMAPSWLRIGSFQIHSSRAEWESVRILGEYVCRSILQLPDAPPASKAPWATRMLHEVARRNAVTFARWQCAGFMHGVLNTDNIALTGHTIDYGPYGFMDRFDQGQICNHSDGSGRYAYRMQPTMGLFALRQLLLAISPLIGFEASHGRPPAPGELVRASPADLQAWSERGEQEAGDELEALFMGTLLDEWKRGWRARLGLTRAGEGADGTDNDKAELIDPLLGVLEDLDMSRTLRALSDFAPIVASAPDAQQAIEQFLPTWYDATALPEYTRASKETAARKWLAMYAARLAAESRDATTVRADMHRSNPVFVLRNWVTDDVVRRLETSHDTQHLKRVLEMCARPFERWGERREGGPQGEEELAEERRLLEEGKPLSENLPSCSS